jgi:gliding motility-associated-like protein
MSIQNCMGAVPVCQTSYTQVNSPSGFGTLNELNASNQGCLTTGENNSVWYILNVSSAGNLVFTITPASTSDYDFAVWDLTDKSCSAIGAGLAPVRCNYASLANSSPGGLTGLSTASGSASLGAGGPSFSSAIAATSGQTFVIMVNNSSGSAAGYTINFSGSTCTIADNQAPTIKSDTLPAGCNAPTSMKILLSENVKCSSFQTNGSDFQLTPAVTTITSASSAACASGSDFTNLFTINFASGLAAGTYTLSVKNGSDANTLIDNCNNAMPVGSGITFTVLPAITASVSVQFGCAGTPTGVITASVVGGTPPFTYKLNNGTYSANSTFSGLNAGTYTIYVKDINNCVDDTVVNLTASPPINITSVSVTNLTCYGANNGSITVLANGGNPPLTYNVNVQAFTPSNIISNLAPGSYVVNVKDANGCTSSTVAFLSSPGQILVNTLSITNPTCGTNNGAITITAFGGTPPLNYALNAGGYQTSGAYTGLAAGTYTLHIKDGNNCIKDTIVSVIPIGGVSVSSLVPVQPSCVGNAGSITANGSGGVTPYTYSINGVNFQASNAFTSLSSGTYTVTIKDANNCTATSSITLISPANLYFSGAVIVSPTCVNSGSITVTGIGGAAPYTYAINANPYGASNFFGGLLAGTYVLHVKDVNNCTHDTTITLNLTQIPTINSLAIINPSCSFPTNGSINTNASGGTPPLSYSLNGGAYVASGNFTGLTAGTYTITVRDANNCTHSSIAVLNSSNTLTFASFGKANVGCGGTPLGSINATAGNGNPAYQYSLNGGPYQASGSYTGLNAGTYTITARDASNCTVSSVVVITSSAIVAITSLTKTNSSCHSPGNGTITVTGNVSAAPISYYFNPIGGNTTGIVGGLGPGTYTVSVYDANGCHKDTLVTITAPPPLYFTNQSIVYPPCYGGTGSISMQGAGGTPGYTYGFNGGAFGGTTSWPNLLAGTYTISLKDANNCIKDTVIYLIQPPTINITGLALLNASCNNAPTGSITVTANGGVSPYTYALNAGAYGATNSFTNLAAGTYTVHVKDANNCIKDTIISLNNNGNFYVTSIGGVLPSCFNGNDGSVNLTVTGGVPPYQYALNAGPFGASNTFNGLTSGFYTLHAIDNSGCSRDTVVFLSQPVQLGFSNITLTPALCAGTNTGTANVSGTGGTPGFQYKIDAGSYSASGSFSGLAPGNHTISVRDSKNCVKDTVITILEPLPVGFANVTVIPPGCFSNVGVISIGGTGGVSPYTFALGAGPYQASGSFNNLPIGTYTLHVQDANGCIHDTIISITLNQLIFITSLTHTAVLCPGFSNGVINVLGSSAYIPVQYSINGGTQQLSGNFNGLSAGTYTVHVEDQLGCFVDSIITILAAPPINISNVTITSPLCYNTLNGSILINAIGGMGPLNYSYNISPYSPNNLLSNIGIGTYTLHVKDSLNCQKDSIVTVNGPAPIVITSITLTAPFCNIATNGSITINASGGQAPYQYAINNSLFTTNNTFSNLIQGNYTIQVMDINGCIKDTVITLNASPYLTFTNVTVQNVSCKFGADGSINLNVVGGFSPYQFTINSIPNGTSGNFSNLGIGTYTIVATDNIGCSEDTVLNITEPLLPLTGFQTGMIPNKCKSDSAGSFTAGASGGTSPYTYSIDGINFQSSNQFNNLPAGTFVLTVKDANGCVDDTLVTITEPLTSVQLNLLGIKDISCLDVNDGSITVTTIHGQPPLEFFLNGVSMGIDTLYTSLSPGEYIVVVEDSIGCKSTGKYTVKPSDRKPKIIIDSLVGVLCAGDKDGYLEWHAEDCFPPYRYIFNTVQYGATNYAANITNGSFFIQVLDTLGCYGDTTVSINAGNEITLNVTPTAASCSGTGDDGKAMASVVGGISPYSYWWSGSPSKAPSVSQLKYGLQWAYIKDSLGCVDSTQFEIAYDPCCVVNLPNAFSPNDDGKNDEFRIIRYGNISLMSLEVYNRWGEQVFRTTDLNIGWDGRYKGQECEINTYFYLVRYKCPLSDQIELIKGDVILVR